MNTALLWILDRFQWLFQGMKVDYPQMRAIVHTKFIMDNRRQLMSLRQKSQDADNKLFVTVILYAVIGIVIAMVMAGIPSFTISMIFFYSYIMVMTSMTLITDFSSVLLDTSDNSIILPRPVSSRTRFVARLVHILIYLGLLTFGLCIVPAVVVAIKYGLVFLMLFAVGIMIATLASLSITNAAYLLILRYFSEEKLKNVINYFQIMMAILVMGSYQIMPRILNRLDPEELVFDIQWWAYFTPPVWIAGALEAFYEDIYDPEHMALIVIAIIVPPLLFYLINRFMTSAFNKKLGSLSSTGESKASTPVIQRKPLALRLSNILSRHSLEQAAFQFVYKMLGRDRKIKLKIYPNFGYVVILALVFMIGSERDFVSAFQNLPETKSYMIMLYVMIMILQVAVYEIPYSDDFKASWIYYSAPLDRPGLVLSGMLKAIFVRLFVPVYFVISVIVIAVWGPGVINDVLLAFVNNFLLLLSIALINQKAFPLSLQPSVRSQTGNFIRGMILLLIVGALGFGHFILSGFEIVITVLIVVQSLLAYALLHVYQDTKWDKITA